MYNQVKGDDADKCFEKCLDIHGRTGELDVLFAAISSSNTGHSASISGNAEKQPDPILKSYMMRFNKRK